MPRLLHASRRAPVGSLHVLVVSAWSCTDSAPVYVAWPEPPSAVSFFVQSVQGRATEIQGPFTADDDRARAEFEPQVGGELHVLGFELPGLERAFPRHPRPFPSSSLELLPEAETCAEGRSSAEGGRHSRTVAASNATPSHYRLDLEEAHFVIEPWPAADRLSLRAPEDAERCLDEVPLRHYRAFGAREALLEGTAALAGVPIPTRRLPTTAAWDLDFRGAVRLDPNRVLAHTLSAVFLVERDAELTDGPTRYRHLTSELDEEPAGVLYAIEQLVLDPRTRAGPSHRVLVVIGGANATGPPRPGRILELTVDASGLSSTRELWRSSDQTRRAAMEPSGRALVVGERGLLVLVDPDPEVPPTELRLGGGLPWLTDIFPTGDPERPHLIATEQGEYLLGDAPSGRMEPFPGAGALLGLPMAAQVTRHGSEFELLSWLRVAGLRRWRPHTGWQPVALSFGAALLPCTSSPDECGRRQPASISYSMLGLAAGHYLLSVSECDSLFLLDLEAGCGRGVYPTGRAQAARSTINLRGLVSDEDGSVIAVGSGGRVMELVGP